MPRIAYVNGRYIPFRDARVHVEDRGLQFSDGIYEVIAVLNGRLLDADPHMARLERSLAELSIDPPMGEGALRQIMARMVRLNRVEQGLLYLQINRGVAPRGHAFPSRVDEPSIIMTLRRFDFAAVARRQDKGVGVALVPDQRWARRDIKSVSLLANCLAKQEAAEAGAFEAFMVAEDGMVTEGSSTTAFIIDKDGVIRTRRLGTEILPGITRRAVLDMAAELNIKVAEEAFSVDQLTAAREVFLASTSSFVMPVTAIDGKPVGNGAPGSITQAIGSRYWQMVADQTGFQRP